MEELKDKGHFTLEDGTQSFTARIDPKKKYGVDCVLPKKALSPWHFFLEINLSNVI